MRKNALKNFARGGKGKANSKFNKIFLKSYSPTVTHDKIFVYDFFVLWWVNEKDSFPCNFPRHFFDSQPWYIKSFRNFS